MAEILNVLLEGTGRRLSNRLEGAIMGQQNQRQPAQRKVFAESRGAARKIGMTEGNAMFHITLITVGKLKERYYAAAADEYIRRLGAYCKFELIELPECRLFPPRANRVLGPVCSGLCYIFFASQLVYYSIFHCFYSAYSMGNGGQVMQFWKVTLHAIRKNWLPLSLMLLPPVGHAVLGKRFSAARLRLPYLPAFAALAVAVHFGLMALLPVFGTQPLSAYDLYHSTNDMKQTTAHLGLMPAFRLDVHRLLFGFEGGEIELATETKAPMEAPTEAPTEPALPDATEPTVLPEPVVDTSPNVLELDFDAVPTERNDVLSELNAYFSSRTPTNKNEKTGMFKGCNLILITAESFSYLAIDPELTPTLYKLQTEGFNFTNFYTPYWDVSTSDGEYAALTGTIPKPGTWSFRDSAENAMPLTMAQQLKRLGYSAYAYHDHTYTYYDRNLSHPNLGYVYRALGNGLDVEATWPESDIEMIDKTTADYMGSEPFHAYYMTVSGHLEYNFNGNAMAKKNQDLVKDLPYSGSVRAYLACQIELDRALELLLQRLDEAGVAENTVIALTGDHYPYGLTDEEQSELAGHEIDTRFERYRNAFILYKKGMKPERVDSLCCTLDILPTLSNLFGLDFDSRLYMGRDVFSDAEPFVLLRDHSWITENAMYYAPLDELILLQGDELTPEEVEERNQDVSNRFRASEWVLDQDYWRYLFGDNLPPDGEN